MAGLTQALCTSFKVELMQALHNFTASTGNAFKMALFKAGASIVGTYGAATTNYSDMTGNSDEVTGTGYSAGGVTLTNVTPTSSGTTAFNDFADAVYSAVTITTRGALIYNSTNGNRAVCVLDFGADKSATAGDFTVIFPTPDASNAIIRLA
jgi:hypothetical protein